MIPHVSYDFDVAWGDCDPAGIIFYPTAFRWFDIGSHKLMTSSGFGQNQLMSDFGIVGAALVSAKCDYLHPMTYGDRLTHRVRVSEWRDRSFDVSHTLLLGDKVTAQGQEIRVFMARDENGHRAISIPAQFRKAVEALARKPG